MRFELKLFFDQKYRQRYYNEETPPLLQTHTILTYTLHIETILVLILIMQYQHCSNPPSHSHFLIEVFRNRNINKDTFDPIILMTKLMSENLIFLENVKNARKKANFVDTWFSRIVYMALKCQGLPIAKLSSSAKLCTLFLNFKISLISAKRIQFSSVTQIFLFLYLCNL